MTALLGDRIRKAREHYGMSQAELARRIGISKQAMYQMESNQTVSPGALLIAAIARQLRVSADYLLGLSDDESPSTRNATASAAV